MIWLVVFFPLNNMQTYGNTNVNDIATYEYSPVAQNQIVDLTEPVDPQNTLQDFLSCFSFPQRSF